MDDGGVPTGPIDVTIGSGGTAVTRIAAGDVQTEKCATAISYKDCWFVTQINATHTGTGSATVTFRFETRPLFDQNGTALSSPNWRPRTYDWQLAEGSVFDKTLDPPILVGPNTDVRISAWASATNQDVTADMSGYLAVDLDRVGVADPDPA